MSIERKKLYFLGDFTLATNLFKVFPCTQFRSTKSYTGDVYGGVLKDLAPLTVGSSGAKKSQNEVTAWARVISQPALVPAVTNAVSSYHLDFVNATTLKTAATILVTTVIKTAVGGTLGVNGVTPILTRHFGVRVTRRGSAAVTGKVMVYVQRQHSIEV